MDHAGPENSVGPGTFPPANHHGSQDFLSFFQLIASSSSSTFLASPPRLASTHPHTLFPSSPATPLFQRSTPLHHQLPRESAVFGLRACSTMATKSRTTSPGVDRALGVRDGGADQRFDAERCSTAHSPPRSSPPPPSLLPSSRSMFPVPTTGGVRSHSSARPCSSSFGMLTKIMGYSR